MRLDGCSQSVPLAPLLAWMLGALVVAAVGCDRRRKTRSELFDEAEAHYRAGEYDAALDDYQAFVRQYPRNRLAETARLRIRSINREVQNVMDRDDMPAPDYVATVDGGGSAAGAEEKTENEMGRREGRTPESDAGTP